MVKFSFSMRGYLFQTGLDDMRRAFESTIAALHTVHENAQSEWLRVQKEIEAGNESAYVCEDGEILHSKETLHHLLIEQSVSPIPIAINAFVVMLHHYWEKSVDTWRQARRGDNYRAVREYEWLEAHGLAPDRDQLELLRTAANTIKHNNPELHTNRPDLFQLGHGNAVRPDYAGALRFTERDFLTLLDAVRRSGLQIDGCERFPAAS